MTSTPVTISQDTRWPRRPISGRRKLSTIQAQAHLMLYIRKTSVNAVTVPLASSACARRDVSVAAIIA